MSTTQPRLMIRRDHVAVRRAGWWSFFLLIASYSAYAVYLAGLEVLAIAGVVDGAKPRALPVAFVVHAVTGGVALTAGALQFNRRLRIRRRGLHRVVGRVYVGAIWAASITGLASALLFDVAVAARVGFGVVALLWFVTTTIALVAIRRREVARHREWMIRSYALSLFFVTLELWAGGLDATPLTADVAYPLAVWMAWLVNLLSAEARIRVGRRARPAAS